MKDMRFFSLLLAAGLAGCAPAGGSGGAPADGSFPEPEGAILKVSYYRAYPEPRTKRLEPTYKVVMTDSWREKLGESPRDHLVKAAPGKLYIGFMGDANLRKYVGVLKEKGIERLQAVNTDSLPPAAELQRLALHPQRSEYTRIITIADENGSKSYAYPDQQFSAETIKIFLECEKWVLRIVEHSIHVSVGATHRVFPTDR